MVLRNYDVWKTSYPKEWDNEVCCEDPDIIEVFCGCYYCENCQVYSICEDCDRLDRAGL